MATMPTTEKESVNKKWMDTHIDCDHKVVFLDLQEEEYMYGLKPRDDWREKQFSPS